MIPTGDDNDYEDDDDYNDGDDDVNPFLKIHSLDFVWQQI